MIILLALLSFFDSVIFPIGGIWSSIMFVSSIGLGIWKVHAYRHWFILSLSFITLAVLLFIMGDGFVEESVIHKLSDWSLIYLLVGALKLAKNYKQNLVKSRE